jgi:hypothetical protein
MLSTYQTRGETIALVGDVSMPLPHDSYLQRLLFAERPGPLELT